ncbi:MAG: 30S ribosomal protein S16 [Elusimicrobia bacterium RIFCSPLOWO2_02_FULL_39_32]|nr:MAG: 30S ribosomal protein S16 [Elusimicrobia bacterium RIFCSPHIGHO2_02_FULL_39_36]OGR93628.1 MAG: 30S ribosomal protein S16 [Elusimicrobia bacterium RIFCSPLOWO2_02_FULL_39_32]OGS00449.1 MAG: 30S ribosomal protein S16 [Elusimicrobia bacterium RIFCSPLOWO2_12_FULL_39_28]
MSVRLRLKRVGMTKQPAYRLVAVDRRTARDGAELEILGTYNPKDKENRLIIKEERIKYWISCGAEPSETVKSLLKRHSKVSAPAPVALNNEKS